MTNPELGRVVHAIGWNSATADAVAAGDVPAILAACSLGREDVESLATVIAAYADLHHDDDAARLADELIERSGTA